MHNEPHNFAADGLNAAQSGAVVQDIEAQIEYLEQAIKRLPGADFEQGYYDHHDL